MYIDKSHTKKDLILLFKTLGVPLDELLTKQKIIESIQSKILECKFNDKIKNLTQLLDYLKVPTQKQRPTAEQKIILMHKCKKIIKWAKNDYFFGDCNYKINTEPYDDCMYIHKFGDLSSVRRACKLYNASPTPLNHINPIISEEIQRDMLNNKLLKQQFIGKLVVRRALEGQKIIVTFD